MPDSLNAAATNYMTVDILENVLNYADTPAELGRFLTSHVRQLIGGRIVMLVQCPLEHYHKHTIIDVYPVRYRNTLSEKIDIEELIKYTHKIKNACFLNEETAPVELVRILQNAGWDNSLLLPLNTGTVQVGALFVFDMLDTHNLDDVLKTLISISKVSALILRNSLLYKRQEEIIHARTTELAENEALLRQIIDLIPHLIYAQDKDGHFILANKAVARLYGKDINDLIGETPESIDKKVSKIHTFSEHAYQKIISDKIKILQFVSASFFMLHLSFLLS